ncbi:hypothetical protein VTN96DRAFT_6119 [Rasamsonia emersonii]
MSTSHPTPSRLPSHDAAGSSETAPAKTNASTRIRRRNRMITSCLECRRRKLKCDRTHPCSNCSKATRDCVFLAPSLDSAARLKLTELKERMGSLERSLEEEVAGRRSQKASGAKEEPSSDASFATAEPLSSQSIPDDEKNLEPTLMATQDAVYEDEADDDVVDLGFQLGKMRLTDRLGGFFRPRLADELATSLDGDNADKNPSNAPDSSSGTSASFLNPGPTFIAPRSDMLFGLSNHDHALLDFLPTKAAADKLMQHYWEAVHPVARIVHRPSFEKRYEQFWEDVTHGIEPKPSIQAVVFAALFTAVVSMPQQTVLDDFGVSQQELVENFRLGTETALGKAHILRTTKIETLQAFVMYLEIPMCRDAISRAHSAMVGAAIRLAECMGLHRDPTEYNHPPVETHVRRLIWYQLCFLDIRTAEVQGPRPFIRREDYTTQFPLNLDDAALATGKSDDAQEWTDMTFARIRFECQEMIRAVYIDQIRLEKKTISVTQALGKIESFRKSMDAKYGPLLNGPQQTPIQRAAAVMMSLIINRLYILLLHRYHTNVMVKIPDRLRQVILSTGTQHLEDAIELETSPDLQRWNWYSRAYHNYHTALLLLMDVYYHPMRREADRIWRCLDYVYETPPAPLQPGMTRREMVEHRERKARMILTQLRDRMSVYRAMRKMKYPPAMADSHISLVTAASRDQLGPQAESNSEESTQDDADRALSTDAASHADVKTDTVPTPSAVFSTFLPGPDVQARVRQNRRTNQLPDAIAYQPFNAPVDYHSAQPPQPSPSQPLPSQASLNRDVRGPGMESEGPGSSDLGGHGLWFLPGAEAPAGTVTRAVTSEDLPMLDINWAEWDQLFPPHINDGNINLPPQSLSGRMNLEATAYPPFDPNRHDLPRNSFQ